MRGCLCSYTKYYLPNTVYQILHTKYYIPSHICIYKYHIHHILHINIKIYKIVDTPYTLYIYIYHIRTLMFLWSLGPRSVASSGWQGVAPSPTAQTGS